MLRKEFRQSPTTFFGHLKKIGHLSPSLEFWRPYFFSGFVAQCVSNFFNDYFAERYLWISFAFGAALERTWAAERGRRRRERLEVVRNFGSPELAWSRSPRPAASTTATSGAGVTRSSGDINTGIR